MGDCFKRMILKKQYHEFNYEVYQTVKKDKKLYKRISRRKLKQELKNETH
jgi:hypothetical protein